MVTASKPGSPPDSFICALSVQPWAEGKAPFKVYLTKCLVEGGQGMVYEGVDEEGVHYALKVCKDKSVQSSLEDEAGILIKTKMPYLMHLAGITKDPSNNLILVLPFYPGGDLNGDLRQKHTDEVLARHTVQILLALLKLKKLRIIHRDIKPGNILKDAFGNVALTDFGWASEATDAQPHDQSSCGTEGFKAPEMLVARHERSYDYQLDVWTVAYTMFLLAMGEECPPWDGSMGALYNKAINGQLNDVPLTCSDELRDLLLSMLEQHPLDRLTAEQAVMHPALSSALTQVLSEHPELVDLMPAPSTVVEPVRVTCQAAACDVNAEEEHSLPAGKRICCATVAHQEQVVAEAVAVIQAAMQELLHTVGIQAKPAARRPLKRCLPLEQLAGVQDSGFALLHRRKRPRTRGGAAAGTDLDAPATPPARKIVPILNTKPTAQPLPRKKKHAKRKAQHRFPLPPVFRLPLSYAPAPMYAPMAWGPMGYQVVPAWPALQYGVMAPGFPCMPAFPFMRRAGC